MTLCKLTPVTAEQFDFNERPWPKGVYRSYITETRSKSGGVCPRCDHPYAQHADAKVGSQNIPLCPTSWLVRELSAANNVQVFTDDQFKKYFREIDLDEKN